MNKEKVLAIGLISLLIILNFTITLKSASNLNDYENKSFFSGGSGTESDPYLVKDIDDLQNISNNLEAHYELKSDIDASETKNWNDGKGFNPIGNNKSFNGSLDGLKYEIKNLYISRYEKDLVGLISFLNENASVKNLKLENSYVNGNNTSGGVIGKNNGLVENCFYNGSIDLNNTGGGLVGQNTGVIYNSTFTGNATGNNTIGGISGNNTGEINHSSFSGKINGKSWVGGIVGNNNGLIEDLSSSGKIKGINSIGGLIGENNGKLKKSNSNTKIKGSTNIGGLIGYNYDIAKTSYSKSEVTGDSNIGGLTGQNGGMIETSYSAFNISGDERVGGAVGSNSNVISNSYSLSIVNGNSTVGGLVGYNTKLVNHSYATGKVIGENSKGLIGNNYGKIANSFWDINTTGKSSSDGGTGKTTKNMKEIATYTDESIEGLEDAWDFVSNINNDTRKQFIWNIDNKGSVNSGYPFLNWQDVDGLKKYELTINQSLGGDVINPGKGTFEYEKGTLVALEEKVNQNFSFSRWIGDNRTIKNPQSNNTAIMIGDNFTISSKKIDITNPIADAGEDKKVGYDTEVTLDASNSSDNVGIVEYKWIISMGNHLYGKKVNYTFSLGEHEVRLMVYDEAGNYDDDFVWINVSDMTPPNADAGENKTVEEDTNVSIDGSNSSDNVGIVNYTWTIEGKKYYGEIIDYEFKDPGNYTIELNVSDDAGNWDIDTANITVLDITPPDADAGENKTVEEDRSITLNGSGSSDNVGIVNYTWTIKNDKRYGETVNYIFEQPGNYTVKLNVTDAAGNWDTDTANLTVLDITPPDADAGEDKTVDQGTTVILNGSNSSDNVEIVNYTWTIELYPVGQKVMYGKTVNHTYENTDVFNAVLNVTDAAGNWDTDTVNISVVDGTPPNADAGEDKTVDQGTKVQFNGSNSTDNKGIVNYTWNIEGNIYYGEIVYHTFEKPGNYTGKLNVTDFRGNWDTDTVNITVIDVTPPNADAGEDKTVNVNTTVTLDGSNSTDNVGIVNYSWTIKNSTYFGKIVEYDFKNPGYYTIELNVTDNAGNWDIDTVNVMVEDQTPPNADAGKDKTVDVNTLITFNGSDSTDNVEIVEYIWTIQGNEFKGITVDYKFTDIDSYEVTLTVEDRAGNKDSDSITVKVEDQTPPNADAGNNITVGLNEKFILNGGNSTDNGKITNYTWEIKGEQYYGQQIQHSFSKIGSYKVKLTVKDEGGNIDSDSIAVKVEDQTPPNADAGNNITVGLNEKFILNASESTDNGNIINYTWVINGNNYYGEEISYSFSELGSYKISLIIKDESGNSDSDNITVNVVDKTPPKADAGGNRTVNEDEEIIFNGSESTDNVNILRYVWLIKGEEYEGKEVSYTFKNPGSYKVKLNVTDEAGNYDTVSITVTVLDITKPKAIISGETIIVEDNEVNFSASKSTDNVGIEKYIWTISGSKEYGENIKYTFKDPGYYTVSLKVTDYEENTDSTSINVTVKDVTPPQADAGEDKTVEINDKVTLDGSKSKDNVKIESYEWIIKKEKLTGEKVNYEFEKPGSYTIELIVTDKSGNKATDSIVITVVDKVTPEADAGEDISTGIGTPITFDASDSSDNGNIENYIWRINEEEYNGKIISHSFSKIGTYDVQLTVTDEGDNSDTDTITVTVKDNKDPSAEIDFEGKLIVGEKITFDASDSSDNVGIASYNWDFGNGDTAEGENVTYSFENSGNYTVTLKVTDENGNEKITETKINVEKKSDKGIPGFTFILLLFNLFLVAIYWYVRR